MPEPFAETVIPAFCNFWQPWTRASLRIFHTVFTGAAYRNACSCILCHLVYIVFVMPSRSLPFAYDPATSRVFDIAIVGGGFSGVMTAVHLLRECAAESSVLLVERGDRLGRGIAFGTSTQRHLLNVPAKGMSAFPAEPAHFYEWLKQHRHSDVATTAFVPRQWYGEYLESILAQEMRKENAASLTTIHEETVAIERQQDESMRLVFADGSECHARLVVLAVGNFPPADPMPLRKLSGRRYARYAWSPEALAGISDSESILLIGSGLTAIDQLVALESSGHKGPIFMLSRRGLLPAIHQQEPAWPTAWTEDLPGAIGLLVAKVREQVREAAAQGIGWRAVIDSMRPATQRLWKNMDLQERKRFLRHVRCFWEVHRHRVAPEIGSMLQAMCQSGRLRTEAGRVVECIEHDNHVDVTFRDRQSGEVRLLRVSRIVNCTGHETDARKIDSPIVQSLLTSGLARVDASLQGLEISDDGALIGSDGDVSRNLFALGSVRKGLLWESTAVPELRAQAQALATRLAAELDVSPRALRSVV